MDRQYTFRFFTGQASLASGEEAAFLEWFPYLCDIGRRCRSEIATAIERRGLMATSTSKVIDNAIVGFVQKQTHARL